MSGDTAIWRAEEYNCIVAGTEERGERQRVWERDIWVWMGEETETEEVVVGKINRRVNKRDSKK